MHAATATGAAVTGAGTSYMGTTNTHHAGGGGKVVNNPPLPPASGGGSTGVMGNYSTVAPAQEASYSVCGTVFKVDRVYKDLKPVGKGSYGIVCSAVNSDVNENVAIKRVSPISTHVIDAKHVLREIRMMRYLGAHENIITLKDLFLREAEDELYIVMELLDSDLHRIIQSKQALSEAHFRFFMHQVLKGLKFLHDHRIIHRDLKPGNLLVTRSCELRITDFGLARARPAGKGPNPDESIEEPMTEHVVTRWYVAHRPIHPPINPPIDSSTNLPTHPPTHPPTYRYRPPELMLCPDGLYDYAVDMWSVGCIFAELLGRKPLFPGKNFVHQLTLIFDVIGAPKPTEVAHVKSSQAKRFLESVASKKKVPFATLFPEASADALSLLESLLVFNPSHRLTVDQALAHKYFEPLRNSAQLQAQQQQQASIPEPKLDFAFEQGHLSKGQLKQLIYREVESFRKERRHKLGLAPEEGEGEEGVAMADEGDGIMGGDEETGHGHPSTTTSTSTAAVTAAAAVAGKRPPTASRHQQQQPQHPEQQGISSSPSLDSEDLNPSDLSASASMAPTQRTGMGGAGCLGPHEQASTGYFSASQASSQFSASGASSASGNTSTAGPTPPLQRSWGGPTNVGGGILPGGGGGGGNNGVRPHHQHAHAAMYCNHHHQQQHPHAQQPFEPTHGTVPVDPQQQYHHVQPHHQGFNQTHPLPSIYQHQQQQAAALQLQQQQQHPYHHDPHYHLHASNHHRQRRRSSGSTSHERAGGRRRSSTGSSRRSSHGAHLIEEEGEEEDEHHSHLHHGHHHGHEEEEEEEEEELENIPTHHNQMLGTATTAATTATNSTYSLHGSHGYLPEAAAAVVNHSGGAGRGIDYVNPGAGEGGDEMEVEHDGGPPSSEGMEVVAGAAAAAALGRRKSSQRSPCEGRLAAGEGHHHPDMPMSAPVSRYGTAASSLRPGQVGAAGSTDCTGSGGKRRHSSGGGAPSYYPQQQQPQQQAQMHHHQPHMLPHYHQQQQQQQLQHHYPTQQPQHHHPDVYATGSSSSLASSSSWPAPGHPAGMLPPVGVTEGIMEATMCGMGSICLNEFQQQQLLAAQNALVGGGDHVEYDGGVYGQQQQHPVAAGSVGNRAPLQHRLAKVAPKSPKFSVLSRQKKGSSNSGNSGEGAAVNTSSSKESKAGAGTRPASGPSRTIWR